VGKALEARGLAVEIDFLEGNASEVILRRARQIRADLIAITTHSHTGIDRVMFGSVAEEVLRRASCPVLLVRVRGGR
jgi:nucleotide-binding universal stress UspA family protein